MVLKGFKATETPAAFLASWFQTPHSLSLVLRSVTPAVCTTSMTQFECWSTVLPVCITLAECCGYPCGVSGNALCILILRIFVDLMDDGSEGEENFSCLFCNFVTTSSREFEAHKHFPCKRCPFVAAKAAILRAHTEQESKTHFLSGGYPPNEWMNCFLCLQPILQKKMI